MIRPSTLHTAQAGHRSTIMPAPRYVSNTAHLAAIRQLETDGLLTQFEAARARARVGNGIARLGRKEA